jgi:hypothetical protein
LGVDEVVTDCNAIGPKWVDDLFFYGGIVFIIVLAIAQRMYKNNREEP